MKILYIAPVRDFSGYAAAARGYINALHRAGADLVVRAIRYDRADSGSEYKPTELERSLLLKPLNDIDVVIQHTTPNELRPVAGKINIAVVAWETNRIPEYWAKKLNQFDAVMTFCQTSVDAFVDSGVTVPVTKIPHTFDIPSYTLDGVDKMHSEKEPGFFDGRFVFYNISQLSTKKGIDVLLRSYLTEFHGKDKDKVLLVLKTYIDMANRGSERQRIQAFVAGVKNALRLPADGYPPIMVISNTLTDKQLKKIHKTGDAYVCSSRAEGWCIPAFEALAYGKKLITTSWGGMGEFALKQEIEKESTNDQFVGLSVRGYNDAHRENVFPVVYTLEPLVGQHHGDPELYTAKDLIAEPSVRSMMKQMRIAMTADLEPKPDLKEFDYSNVGPMMLAFIDGVVVRVSKELENV
jgi:glycosyltransferase involved in cell wall biosynthesis